MSERTAMRIGLLLGLAAWIVAGLFLWRTSVPPLSLGGLDPHRAFPAGLLARAHRFGTGERALWLGRTAAVLATLGLLARRLPPAARRLGLGRVGSAVVLGMVAVSAVWAVRLPFSVADLVWRHRYGLGPVDVGSWLAAEWAALSSSAVAALAAIALLVALAVRFPRGWWIPGGAVAAAPRRRADRGGRARPRAGARAGGVELDGPAERVHGRVRPLDARRPVGHAPRRSLRPGRGGRGDRARARPRPERPRARGRRLGCAARVPARAPRRGGDAAPGRPARAREPPARVPSARGRRARARAARERGLAPLRGRGGLARARGDARPGRRRAALPRLRTGRARGARPAPLGLPLPREPPDDRPAARAGGGVRPAHPRGPARGAAGYRRSGVSGRSLIPFIVEYFDQESFSASISSFVNCWDMFTRATTTPGISPSSTEWSMRANVTVNS